MREQPNSHSIGQPDHSGYSRPEAGKGSEKTPAGCNAFLHLFTLNSAFKIDNDNYSYRDNGGMYLYWQGDEMEFAESTSTAATAPETPSSTAFAFNSGFLALAGIGGLVIGILGITIVMFPMIKKKRSKSKRI